MSDPDNIIHVDFGRARGGVSDAASRDSETDPRAQGRGLSGPAAGAGEELSEADRQAVEDLQRVGVQPVSGALDGDLRKEGEVGSTEFRDASDPPGRSPGLESFAPMESSEDPLGDLYSAQDVSRLFGLSASRLRGWARRGFIVPSGQRGSRRYYTFSDLIGVRTAKSLLDSGVSVRQVEKALDSLKRTLPRVTRPLNELRVMADGKEVVVKDGDRAFVPQTGQCLLNFEVDALREDVVRKLRRHQSSIGGSRAAYDLYLEGCRLDEDEATFDRAEAAYRKALELDPGLANALTNLGNIRYRRGFPEEAENYYLLALKLDEEQPEAHYNLGFLHFDRGDTRAAVASFELAVQSDPGFADAHFNLAMALEEAGAAQDARGHWGLYLQLEPDGAWAEVARRHLGQI